MAELGDRARDGERTPPFAAWKTPRFKAAPAASRYSAMLGGGFDNVDDE